MILRHGSTEQQGWYRDTILTFDSLYATAETRRELKDNYIRYVMSVKKNNMSGVFGDWCNQVDRPGRWAGRICEDPDNFEDEPDGSRKTEIAVFRWSQTESIGKKYCLTNVYHRRTKGYNEKKPSIIPGFDLYNVSFQQCDEFNRAFKDRKFPHRSGGGRKTGHDGHVFKFVMATTFQNILNIFDDIHRVDYTASQFSQRMLELADEIVEVNCQPRA